MLIFIWPAHFYDASSAYAFIHKFILQPKVYIFAGLVRNLRPFTLFSAKTLYMFQLITD